MGLVKKMNQEEGNRKKKTKRSSIEIKELVDAFKCSGLRQSDFCRRNDLQTSVLGRHLKMRQQELVRTRSGSDDGRGSSKFALLEVQVQEPDRMKSKGGEQELGKPGRLGSRTLGSSGVEEDNFGLIKNLRIELQESGFRVQVPIGFDSATLLRLVAVLEEAKGLQV